MRQPCAACVRRWRGVGLCCWCTAMRRPCMRWCAVWCVGMVARQTARRGRRRRRSCMRGRAAAGTATGHGGGLRGLRRRRGMCRRLPHLRACRRRRALLSGGVRRCPRRRATWRHRVPRGPMGRPRPRRRPPRRRFGARGCGRAVGVGGRGACGRAACEGVPAAPRCAASRFCCPSRMCRLPCVLWCGRGRGRRGTARACTSCGATCQRAPLRRVWQQMRQLRAQRRVAQPLHTMPLPWHGRRWAAQAPVGAPCMPSCRSCLPWRAPCMVTMPAGARGRRRLQGGRWRS